MGKKKAKKQTISRQQVGRKLNKNKKRKIRYGRILLCFVLVTILSFLVFHFVHFPIRNIFICGNHILNDQEIIEMAGLSNYPSIFQYSSFEISKKLKKNKYIQSVKIRKRKLKEVHIEITENIPILYNLNSKETIFSDGKAYKGMDSSCTLLNYVPDDIFNTFIHGFISMDFDVRSRVSEIQYVPNDVDSERFLLTMNDGNYVYITLGKIILMDNYIDIIKNFNGKKGILYLDSGEYFEIKEN